VANLEEFKRRVIEACKNKSAANGLRALRVELKRLDRNKNGRVESVDFKFGLRAFGVDI